jgi:prepilin-type N-terminal cleavage/methylation domain-containing protein
MRNQRGFTLMEVVVVMGVVGLLAAVALPGMQVAAERNKIFTSADLVAAQLREARLAAITRNARFRVRFDCPAPGAMRMLAVTGNAAIDNALDRCSTPQDNDGPAVYMAQEVSFGVGDGVPPTLEFNGRGQVTAIGANMPQTISLTYGEISRNVIVTATGRVRTPSS